MVESFNLSGGWVGHYVQDDQAPGLVADLFQTLDRREEAEAHYRLWVGHDVQDDQAHGIDVFWPLSFPSITVSPAILTWNDGIVVRLAQAAHDERHLPTGTLDNVRLAVLADALEEAGCANEQILGHLRGPGPHVRGCWVLDLLLGKE
jgi:hypothetical protein